MIPLFRARIPESAATGLAGVLASGFVNQGEWSARFERALATYLDAGEVLATNSCTNALAIAVRLSGARTVVTTPMTFLATTTAICQAGAVPVWADVASPFSCQLGAASVRDRMRSGVPCQAEHNHRPWETWLVTPGAIMAVAWGGWLPDLAALRAVADEFRVPLILDAAQALGATFDGRPLHHWADYVCYSFSPTKHLTTGDGGALVCRNPGDRERARRLSWFGLSKTLGPGQRVPSDQDVEEWGWKANATNLIGALGLAGLEGLPDALRACRSNAALYDTVIWARRDERDGRTLPSPWFYTVFTEDPEAVIAHFTKAGVTAMRPHRRNDAYPFADSWRPRPTLLNTDAAASRYLALPVGWWLTAREAARVAEVAAACPGLLR